MSEVLEFTVHGIPRQQGSKRAWVNQHTGKAQMLESNNDKLRPWRAAVTYEAVTAMREQGWTTEHGPVGCSVEYYMPRPKKHYRTGKFAGVLRDDAPDWCASTPDMDKLDRAIRDALSDAQVWKDDRQVAESMSGKYYTTDACPTPAAHIRVYLLGDA